MSEAVHRLFSVSIENRILAADKLEKDIAHTAELLVESLLGNGKIMIVGDDYAASNSMHFASILLSHFELERPALPVIALSNYQAEITSARQIQALGQTHDILIILSVVKASVALIQAVQAAHDKDIRVIALTSSMSDLSQYLKSNDKEVLVPGDTNALVNETQLFVLDCFCDLIEKSLFGQVVE